MRWRTLIATLVVVATVGLVTGQLLSQDKPAQKPADKPAAGQMQQGKPGEMPPEMADMMKKYQEMNALGPQHKDMAKAVGAWDAMSKMWMAPDAPPMESKGTAMFKTLLDGRYLQQEYNCDGMMGSNQPFKGIGIEGYDNFKKQYVSTWIDNMSTGILTMYGTADASGKVVTYEGKMDDPMTGAKDKKYKAILRHVDDNQVVYEMYDTTPDGKEFKTMEITYTRKAGMNR
jgi:hypothetical protein